MKLDLMTEPKRYKIIKDLLLRKPKGEKGQSPSYTVEEYYCYNAHKDKNRVKSNHPGWGYTSETLWDLGFRGEGDVTGYIFEKFYKTNDIQYPYYLTSGKRAGVTRKANRIWNRISSSLSTTRSSGKLAGLYQVRVGWSSKFFFYGESQMEVDTLAKTMLSAIYPDDELTVTFVDKSLPGDILDRNIKGFESLETEVNRKRERADELKKAADLIESQADFVKTLITQNLELAMRVS